MLTSRGVIIRYVICLSCFLLSGSGTITGWAATICGVFGTIELATALLRYSPLLEMLAILGIKVPNLVIPDKLRYSNYYEAPVKVYPSLKKSI